MAEPAGADAATAITDDTATDASRQLDAMEQIARIRALADELDRSLFALAFPSLDEPLGMVQRPDGDAPAVIVDHQWVTALSGVAGVLGGVAERAAVVTAQALVDTGYHRPDGWSTPARWLEHHLGLSRADAQRLVRADRALRHLDDARAAFHDNELRLAHVDSIARIVPSHFSVADQAIAWDAVADSQDDLVHLAGTVSPTAFARFCQKVRDRLDLDGPPDRAVEPSRLWLTQGFAGRWLLTGDLDADDGAMLATWLDERRRALLRRPVRPDGSIPTSDEAASDDPDAVPRTVPDRRPLSEIDADALLELVRDGAGAKRPGRVGLYLHADLADLTDHSDDAPRHAAHTDANLDISTETLWGLLEGADITPVIWSSGQPLSYGLTRRCAPEILRRMLAHRDRTCRFPACDVAATRTQVHHVVHAGHDGPTDPANTLTNCTPHHDGHHDDHWTLGYDADRDEAWATLPGGRDLSPEPRWRRHRRRRLGSAESHEQWLADLAQRLAARGVRLR